MGKRVFSWSGNVESSTDTEILSDSDIPDDHHVVIEFVSLETGSNTTVALQMKNAGGSWADILDEAYGDPHFTLAGMVYVGLVGSGLKVVGGGSGSEGYLIVSGSIVPGSELDRIS